MDKFEACVYSTHETQTKMKDNFRPALKLNEPGAPTQRVLFKSWKSGAELVKHAQALLGLLILSFVLS